jgi:hypothetical protein
MQTQHSYRASSSPTFKDVLRWPSGSGFTGADAWRQHTPSQSERDCLDNLMGQALLDQGVRHRLLVQRDPTLLDALDLSEDTRRWLASVQASTLKEFAQAIVAESTPYRERMASGAI